jgi:hypothetical protein
VITNNAYIEAGAFLDPDTGDPGSLPGSLPGSIPGSIVFDSDTPGSLPGSAPEPGSLPGSEVGHTMYASDTMEIKPTAFELTPTTAMTTTPWAIHVYTLTLENSGATDVFTLTTANDRSGWESEIKGETSPVTFSVSSGMNQSVSVTVVIPASEVTNWVTNTTVVTATSGSGKEITSTLKTWLGGVPGPGPNGYVGCRFDVNYSGRLDVADSSVILGSGRFFQQVGDSLYDRARDMNHSKRLDVADSSVMLGLGRFFNKCPAP